jgi:hypothetical protein
MSAIVADLTTVLERMLDRWERAFAAMRTEDYSAADFAKDLADGWMDASYLSMMPGARLGGLKLELTKRLPVARFIVTDKTAPMTKVIRVDGGAGTMKDALSKPMVAPIPAANYTATLAIDGEKYLYVTLDCPAVPAGTVAGVYAGMVRIRRRAILPLPGSSWSGRGERPGFRSTTWSLGRFVHVRADGDLGVCLLRLTCRDTPTAPASSRAPERCCEVDVAMPRPSQVVPQLVRQLEVRHVFAPAIMTDGRPARIRCLRHGPGLPSAR